MKKLLCIILLLLCLTASVSHSQSFKMFGQIPSGQYAEGLVFYWRGIEAAEAVDESYFGNHGTIINATWVGNALDFNGTDSRIDLPTAISNIIGEPLTDFTYTAWINVSGFPETNQGMIHCMQFNNVISLSWRRDGSGEHFDMFVDYATTDSFTQTSDIGDAAVTGVWTFVVGVHKVSTGISSIYINGIEEISYLTQVAGTGGRVNRTGLPVSIGAQYDGTKTFNGLITDASIYNRALSASEIAALYINPNLPMQQPPIWLLQPPPSVVTGQVIIITKHEKKSTIMSILSYLWEGIWLLV